MKSVTAFVWILCAVAVASFLVLLNYNKAVDSYDKSTITVQGTAERFVTPDIATISFEVSETAKTVSAAQDLATQKMNKVVAYLKESSVDEKDIRTTGYQVYPEYEYFYEFDGVRCLSNYCPPPYVYKNEIKSYRVAQSVQVKVRKIDDAGKILSGICGFQVSNVSGLSFEVEDIENVREAVKNEAIKDARAKAKERAKSLGVSLGDIVSVSDDGYYPIYYGKAVAMDSSLAISEGRGGGGDAMPVPPEVPAGENQIVSNVTIVFEIK